MRVVPATAEAFARLLSWDAPFLPRAAVVGTAERWTELEVEALGVPLDRVRSWPRGQRSAVASQLVAAAAFLFERGWFVSSGLLRGSRVERRDNSPWLRLTRLPRCQLDSPRILRRPIARRAEATLADLLVPLLAELLPEADESCREAMRRRPPWEAASALLAGITSHVQANQALRHPAGGGRALWARRFAVPESGIFWLEEPTLAEGLVTAARLAATARGRTVEVQCGAWEEPELARRQAWDAAAGRDSLLLTTLAVPGVSALPLAGGEDAVWVFAQEWALARAHLDRAAALGRERPRLVGEVLSPGAASGFSRPPASAPPVTERARSASPEAREALAWLASAPVGLAADELAALGCGTPGPLAELERAGLIHRRDGLWQAAARLAEAVPERLAAMATSLGADSPRRLVALALAGQDHDPLVSWCEARLEAGDVDQVTAPAGAIPGCIRLALLACEAALALGRLSDAERLLESVGAEDRGAEWHALAAWWAEQAGLPARASEELVRLDGGSLAPRLGARAALVAGELARRKGEREAARDHFRRSAALSPVAGREGALALAVEEGPAAVRAFRRSLGDAWRGDLAARTFHLLGLLAWERGALAAVGTAFRCALRTASGANPRLLGEIHGDLGTVALLLERPALAERQFLLAGHLLERCGSRRAVTVVEYNRALVACDLLQWRRARDLVLASRELRGGIEDASYWLEELELLRADLARGDAAAAEKGIATVAAKITAYPDNSVLRQALTGLRAHLALARGDLVAAAAAAGDVDEGDRALLAALVRADHGESPQPGLPIRWGLSLTAAALAAWRRGGRAEAAAILGRGLAETPLEGAVGVARLWAVLGHEGETPGEEWAEPIRRAEEALTEAGLDGWAAILRRASRVSALLLVRALDDVVNAGTDALNPARLSTVAQALGLAGLELRCGGTTVAAWGERRDAEEVVCGAVRVTASGRLDAVGRATLGLLARFASALARPEGESTGEGGGTLLGGSAAIAGLRGQIARWGPLPVTVLIEGEPGTGKELVARELHLASGCRGPLQAINCAGMPATLLEAELFGVVRGAFTGADRDRPGLVEAAEGGTLFLDEIGELPMELQGKLLRLLQEREVRRVGGTHSRTVDVRFLAATNRDLARSVEDGRFRRDLYYRLAVAVIATPPLREHRDDIPELASHFAARWTAAFRRPGVRLAPAALAALRQADWPGNVRELESAVARAVAAAQPGESLGPDRFPGLTVGMVEPSPSSPWPAALEQFRRGYFTGLLHEAGGNRTLAARRAGISRQTLLYHLRELGIGRKPG